MIRSPYMGSLFIITTNLYRYALNIIYEDMQAEKNRLSSISPLWGNIVSYVFTSTDVITDLQKYDYLKDVVEMSFDMCFNSIYSTIKTNQHEILRYELYRDLSDKLHINFLTLLFYIIVAGISLELEHRYINGNNSLYSNLQETEKIYFENLTNLFEEICDSKILQFIKNY